MKICCISTSAIESPPRSYGGIEWVIYNTATELAKLGNEVTLITTKDSPKLGQMDAVDDSGAKKGSLNVVSAGDTSWSADGERRMYLNYREFLEKEFGEGQGVVLDMSWWAYCYNSLTGCQFPEVTVAPHPKMKIVHSTQGMSNWIVNNQYMTPPGVEFPRLLGISSAHAQYLSSCFKKPVRYVWNGIDLPPFEPKPSEGFLLSLNRFSKEKGIHNVIDVALQCGIPTKLVGDDIHIADQNYAFEIQDRCEKTRGLVEYVGSVDNEKKWDYIKKCNALIACPDPTWIEAFGIYAVEGFSQGKPILALRNGGLMDTVKQGVNGFLCNNVGEMVNILKFGAQVYTGPINTETGPALYMNQILKLENLKPENIRKTAEEFTTEKMGRQYFDLIEKVQIGAPDSFW